MYVDNGKGSLGPSVKMMTRHQLYNSKSILSKTPTSSNQTVILLFTSCRVLLSTVIYVSQSSFAVRSTQLVREVAACSERFAGLLSTFRIYSRFNTARQIPDFLPTFNLAHETQHRVYLVQKNPVQHPADSTTQTHMVRTQ